jgi:hypothetical protein
LPQNWNGHNFWLNAGIFKCVTILEMAECPHEYRQCCGSGKVGRKIAMLTQIWNVRNFWLITNIMDLINVDPSSNMQPSELNPQFPWTCLHPICVIFE